VVSWEFGAGACPGRRRQRIISDVATLKNIRWASNDELTFQLFGGGAPGSETLTVHHEFAYEGNFQPAQLDGRESPSDLSGAASNGTDYVIKVTLQLSRS
jgi:hypothetical protein